MDRIHHKLTEGQELTQREVELLAEFLLDKNAEDTHKANILTEWATKGETPAEIAYLVDVLLDHALDPKIDPEELEGPTIDVCGTGGDDLGLFNVSTTAMFLVAAAGAYVIKHGNRGVTSRSGGADVLEALGIPLQMEPAHIQNCLQQAGVTFLFAPAYHPAFQAVVNVRRSLAKRGQRTVFNLIGPLLNPARPQCQLVGVMQRELAPAFAEILQRLGRESVWVVHGTTGDGRGVDEVSLMGSTRICKAGSYVDLEDEEIRPRDFDFQHAEVADLAGGEVEENAQILLDILKGRDQGPKRQMVLMNAGAAIACAGLADDMGEGIDLARQLLDQGEGLRRLELFQKIAQT